MRRTKTFISIIALAVLLSCALWAARASADNGSPISYHSGPVMPGQSEVYIIWYGSWFALTGPNSVDTQQIVTNFLIEIGGSPRFLINNTYPDSNGNAPLGILFGATELATTPHGAELTPQAIQAIVSENIGFSRLPLDPKGIYLVIASSDISSDATGFCTPNQPPFHGSFPLGNQQVKYAFIGNAARCPNVAAPQFFAPNGTQLPTPNGNLAADAMVSTILHVLDTTVTDPYHTGWFDGFGLENADKCQGSFSQIFTLPNGARANFSYGGYHNYLLQDNWVNNYGGYCSRYNDAPPRPDNQTVQVNQDTAKPITLTGVDDNGDQMSFIVVTSPQHGALTGSGANRTYTPASNYHGPDSFTFKINDGTLDSVAPATVTISVNSNVAVDGFDPNANGVVRAALVQPDGKILIGGDFTTLAPNGTVPVTRNYIARLNTDGTVDPNFNPSANSSIQSIALQADGKILLGGDFSTFTPNGGPSINRTNIARLNTDGTVDPAFDPKANGPVHTVVVQADGDILLGGDFQQFFLNGGATLTRNRIARVHLNGAVDTSFNPNANSTVDALAVQADGKILVGGRFTTLAPNGGATVARNYVARLNLDGTLDAPFNPNPNNILGSIALQADGQILIGGAFSALAPNGGASVARDHLARLNVDGTLDNAFRPNPNGFVRIIILQPDGRILIGGGFTFIAPNGGTSVLRKYIARLNPDGSLDPGVDENPNDQVFAIAVQPDGKIVVGGVFLSANSFRGQTRNRIARLEADGRVDQTLNINAVGSAVISTAVQADGKILIGGDFTSVLGVPRKNIARLNTDGTLDTVFNPGANNTVNAIVSQPDGKILVGGSFTAFAPNGGASITRNYVARLNADGTVDAAFNPNANDIMITIALQPDGKILLGGFFTALAPNGGASVARTYVVRVNSDGTLDSAFNPRPNDSVYALALQADGKILIGGQFSNFTPNGGATVARNKFARLNVDGAVDSTFDPNPDGRITAIAIQGDGKILIGGFLSALAPFGGASVNRSSLARLNTDGTVDNGFNPGPDNTVSTIALEAGGGILIGGSFDSFSPTGLSPVSRKSFARLHADGSLDAFDAQASNWVFTIVHQPDGKILVGGSFDNIGGQPRNLFARFANGNASIQNVAVTATTVTWSRGGSAPQLSRVTFERSTDGINYSPLGNGTRVGTTSDFILSGQNLPTQQNLYVRARGYYWEGYENAGESITESVRNVFLPPALHLAFAQQPTNTPQNGAITPAVTVQILDAANNPVNSTAAVTIGIGTNPSSGTLAGTKTVAAVGGTATFNDLAIDKLGAGYTLNASGTNLIGAGSNPFNVTVNTPSNIVVVAGSGQSAPINSAFANALQARVTDVNSNPVSAVVVTFTAPASGASGTFANNNATTTATTDANGLATASSFTASGTAGLFAVSASINGGTPATGFSLTNLKANQTVNVTTHAPAGAAYNTQFNVGAVSSSGLPVSFGSSGSCTNNGAVFTMTAGTGNCTVKYEQVGDANHNAAPAVTETVAAQRATQTITFAAIADKVFGESDFAVNASATSGLEVNLASSGNCTNIGGAIHISGAGSCTITASQTGNSAYDAAPNLARSFNIARAGSTTSVVVGDATYDGSAHGGTATATGAGGLSQNLTVTYSGRNGTNYSSSTAPTNAGDYTASASYGGDADHNGSSDSKDFRIARASQTLDFDVVSDKTFGDPDFAVHATAISGLAVSFAATGECTINGNLVHLLGAGSCTLAASQSGDLNYNPAANVQRSFQIAKAAQTISFESLADKTFGDADFPVSLSATSGLPVSLAALGQCSISEMNVHINGAGSCTLTASQAGDANHGGAPDVVRSFQISKASTTTQLSYSIEPGKGQTSLVATVSSPAGMPNGSVTFMNDGAPIESCSALAVASGLASCVTTAISVGTHTFTAEYSGDGNFNASTGSVIGGQSGSTFEFSQATYSVAERGGAVTIIVKRTGDVSSASSVDYLTDDGSVASVAVPCSLATGFALERCDFTRAAGTLEFAANETEKSFVVLVNDDSYTEGTETISLKLSNPGNGALLGSQATATLQINDDPSESLANPVDDNANFVRQSYHDFLNREPDPDGLNFWTNNIAVCDTDGCSERKRVDTSAAFFLSIEFQETGYLVERFYKAAYGDASGDSTLGGPHQLSVPIIRLREFLRDTQEIGQGVIVNQAGWQQQLENRKQAFAREFISRERFRNAYPDSLTAEQFVTRLNANAGAVLTDVEIAQLESNFGGPSAPSGDALKRAQVLRSLAENQIFQQREFNRAFVLMQYFGYLRRNPNDAQDADYTGYDYWLRKLEQFGGNYINAEMVRAFIESSEYRQRFGL